jgi:hypothetical protein
MEKGDLSRDQAIKLAGIDAVNRVDRVNCEPTNRVGYNGLCQGDEYTEWSASIDLDNGETLTVYYYTSSEDEQTSIDNDEWIGDAVDWDAALYGHELT